MQGFVGFDQSEESVSNRVGDHGRFRPAFLLLEDQQWLFELRIATVQLFLEDIDLSILTAEA